MDETDPRSSTSDSRGTAFVHSRCTAEPGEAALVEPLSPETRSFELFRLLRARLSALDAERPLRCVGVVSAVPGEGTTTVGLGLATALARVQFKTLLVEATLREPALERILGLEKAPGLGDWLESQSGPVVVRDVEPWGFSLLSAGKPLRSPGERLGSEPMASLLAAARSSFDFVVTDCPPLDPTADTVALQDLVDGFLLVVRARHASREVIRRAASFMKPGLIRGVVFNAQVEILTRWLNRRSRA